jgi:hypothetical protein
VGCCRWALLLLLRQQQLTCLLLLVMPSRVMMHALALTYPAAAQGPCHCLLLLLLLVE